MARIELTPDTLTVHLEGLNKLWALKSRLDIPLARIRRVGPAPAKPRGLRAPGTRVPGVISAGTYRAWGHTAFWDVRDPAQAIAIDLDGGKYDQVVIQVDDPRAALAAIKEVL